jgi:hypothetical protein
VIGYKIFNELINKSTCKSLIDDELQDIKLGKFKTRIHPKNKLKHIVSYDLFWAKDNKIEYLTDYPEMTITESFNIIRRIETYTNNSYENGEYCMDVLILDKIANQLKSIWLKIDGQYLKVINKVSCYDNSFPDEWAYIYFTKKYLEFIRWRKKTEECLEEIFNIDDYDESKKQLRNFCLIFPPPEEYADQITG